MIDIEAHKRAYADVSTEVSQSDYNGGPASVAFARLIMRDHPALIAEIEQLRSLADGVKTVADEAFGPFPTQTPQEALSAIENGCFEGRKERERLRAENDRLKKLVSDSAVALESHEEWYLVELRASLTAALEAPRGCDSAADSRDEALWAIHVEGPDAVIAMTSRELAEQRAREWNAMFEERLARDPSPYAPVVRAVVVAWPFSAAAHARQIAEHSGNPTDIF